MPESPSTPEPAVRIAVIDSGINADHPHVGNVALGVGFQSDADGKPVQSSDTSDRIGHGTAIAGVIHWRTPAATLIPIRIFHDRLESSATCLVAALEWAIDNGPDIIHLSLGLRGERFKQPLLRICQRADRQNILMVAAARGMDETVYPAAFGNVIGVHDLLESHMDDLVHYPGSPIEFGAHPQPRPLPGLPQRRNFRGASFAAAHVTGVAAAILREEAGASHRIVRCRLMGMAKRQAI